MNFENQTAENRNQINPINNIQSRHIMNPLHYIRTRPIRYMNPLRTIINNNRHCSFCNAIGHNIRSCDDTRLTDFENECLTTKNICDLTNDSRDSFKQWLLYYYMNIDNNLIKSFAIRKCNCVINSSPNLFIENIINYIYQEREEIQEFIPFTEIVSALLLLSDYENNITRNKFTINKSIEKLDDDKSEELCDCAICYEDGLQNKNFITLNCEHKFCKDCFKGSLSHTLASQPIPTCALCRTEILSIVIHEESVKDELSDLIE
jgi:hypothetical protein